MFMAVVATVAMMASCGNCCGKKAAEETEACECAACDSCATADSCAACDSCACCDTVVAE